MSELSSIGLSPCMISAFLHNPERKNCCRIKRLFISSKWRKNGISTRSSSPTRTGSVPLTPVLPPHCVLILIFPLIDHPTWGSLESFWPSHFPPPCRSHPCYPTFPSSHLPEARPPGNRQPLRGLWVWHLLPGGQSRRGCGGTDQWLSELPDHLWWPGCHPWDTSPWCVCQQESSSPRCHWRHGCSQTSHQGPLYGQFTPSHDATVHSCWYLVCNIFYLFQASQDSEDDEPFVSHDRYGWKRKSFHFSPSSYSFPFLAFIILNLSYWTVLCFQLWSVFAVIF